MKSIRLATGIGALVLGGAGMAAAYLVPAAEPDDIQPVSAEGTAPDLSLACAPDFDKTMGEMTAGIGGEDSAALVRTRGVVAGGGKATLQGTDLGEGELRTFFEAGAFPGELVVTPDENPVLAAATTQRYQEFGELAGLAMVPCVPPVSTQYVVGGSTATSSSAQLVLTNVSASPATVQVLAHTSTGTAGPSVISSTTVDAYSSETLLVEAGVRDPRLAFEVTSTGGEIAAHLLLHEVDGISGAGLEVVTAGAEPGTTVVVPGADLSGEHGNVELRVANPGPEDATISISAVTAEGVEDVPGGQDVAVAEGTVLDLSMEGLRGDWAAFIVESDVPVLAGARIDVDGDYAWLPSAVPASRSAVSVPDSDSQLTLYAAEPARADVSFYDHEGTDLGVSSVSVDQLDSVASPEGTSFIVIDADAPVRAGVLTTRTIDSIVGVSGLPVSAPPATSGDLTLDILN